MIDLDDLVAGIAKKPAKVDSSYFNEIVLPYDFDPKAKCPLWLEHAERHPAEDRLGDCRQHVLQEFSATPCCRTAASRK